MKGREEAVVASRLDLRRVNRHECYIRIVSPILRRTTELFRGLFVGEWLAPAALKAANVIAGLVE